MADTGAPIRLGLSLALLWPVFVGAIYVDAAGRGLSRPLIRAMAYGLFGPIGALVYWERYRES